ncbi:MAG: aminotransferase class V-fold PLP-dependent enzyme [Chitinophagaceae bacterium]|nr:aminotransferase class V-fold PLP-dependent enzyme [Chitinophagaceae bacterium]
MDKRNFIKNISLLGAIPAFGSIDKWVKKYEHIAPAQLASDEDFWAGIRKGYRLKPDYINLENGYYCFLPQETLERFIEQVREVNYQGSYYMRTKRFADNDAMAEKLAVLAGCSKEELVITRNTTESLDLVIGGTHWQAGDEAVMAEQDYGAMLDMFKLVAKRYGVVNKVISVPNHPASDEEIVQLYADAITPKTKLLMVCHIINITGQILPVRKICDMAHSKGVKVLVDGAHAFGHFRYSLSELNCDYYGTSLHKWLSVPLGLGFLYVRKENIEGLWPLLGESPSVKENDIHRLNHIGTPPVHTYLAITDAIAYFQKIGPERKEERLRYLQHYWSDKVRSNPNIIVNTPAAAERSCGIANVGVKGMKPADLAETLMKKYKIYTVAIDYANVHGCRITPNIYTTPKELDQLVLALNELAG